MFYIPVFLIDACNVCHCSNITDFMLSLPTITNLRSNWPPSASIEKLCGVV
jgi:hypothetical protein